MSAQVTAPPPARRPSALALFLDTHSRRTQGRKEEHGFYATSDRKSDAFHSWQGGPRAQRRVSTVTGSAFKRVFSRCSETKTAVT